MADRKIFIDDSPKNPDIKMSPFDHSYTNNLTAKFGEVNCAFLKYYPAKSKVKIKPFFGFDMQPLVFPVQTNVRCHIKFYKVPLRILWKDWEDFASQIGSDGLPTNGGGTQYVVPYIKRPTGWNEIGSLAEQIGCCNRKFVGVDGWQPFDAQKCTFGYHLDSNSNTEALSILRPDTAEWLKGLVVPLTSNFQLKPLQYTNPSGNTYDDTLAQVNFISPLSSFSVDGSVHIHLLDNTKRNIFSFFGHSNTHPILSSITAQKSLSRSAYNSSESNVFMVANPISTTINGNTFYRYKLIVKITDTNFLKQITLAAADGRDVSLAFVLSGNLIDLCFPQIYTTNQPISSASISIPTPTTVKPSASEGTQDIECTSTEYVIDRNLGLDPVVTLGTTTVGSEIDTKFDSIDGAEPEQPINALPFRALEFIHNYFMRNPRIDPFVKDGVPTYNKFLTNTDSGADSTTPVEKWNALYETDYFTSCVKEPQFGNAPLVGVTVNDMSDTGILTFSDGTGYNDYTVKLDIDETGAVLPITAYKELADKPNIQRLKEIIDFGISINDLRNVSTFQRMLERLQRTGYRYQNVIYEFFGTNPPVGDHFPQYLGGVTRNMQVNKITQIAETQQRKLGEFAGQGFFNGEGDQIECFCSEPCYIVGVQYFTVTPTYSQYLPKHLLYKDPLDFYLNPDFAYMGPQPVFKKELAPNQITSEHLNDVFGYNRPYAELFSNVDEVHGLYKTEMANYLLQRFFADAPSLNKSFIEINSADLLNIFSVVENSDKLYGQVMFKIHAELPAPRSYMPRSI